MFIKMISRLRRARHFWRYASFTEVGVLYLARILRLLAMNLSSVFILVFLYEIGYSFKFIAVYLIIYYVVKIIATILGGFYIAKHGPKHGLLLSNILYIPMLIIMSTAEEYGLHAIMLGLTLQAFSVAIYDLSYQIDFSKVKDIKSAGKQLSIMYIVEKIAGGLAPMIGGFLAMTIGAQPVMLISAVIFALAAIPLLATEEPMKTNQKINLYAFPWRNFRRNFIAQIGSGFDLVSSNIWALITPIFIFAGQNAYGVLGVLMSIQAVVGVAAAMIYGIFVDKGKGLKLLQIPVYIKSLTLAIRGGFIFNPIGAVASNLVSESTTTGYNMSYFKGAFDAADRSGSRIIYMMAIFIVENIAAAVASAIALLCINIFHVEELGLRSFMVISAVAILMYSTADFPLYRKKSRQYKEE